MKVRFIKHYETKANPPEVFEEDQEVDFAELRGDPQTGRASAQHFINKGVAVSVVEEAARVARHAPKPKPVASPPRDYDRLSLDDLHKEAATRKIDGHLVMDKAALVRAMKKADAEG